MQETTSVAALPAAVPTDLLPTRRRGINRWLLTPSVVALLAWMIIPLAMTLYFSLIRYNLLNPDVGGFAGLENYEFLWTDPAFWPSIRNTVVLIGSVLAATVAGGVLLVC